MVKKPIPKDLVNILACPNCRADLKYDKGKRNLICVKCGSKYPIKGGIPVLVPQKKK